jgi:hypothetical protein
MTPDPLDGFRSVAPDTEFSAEELLLRRQMASNAKLIRLVSRSHALSEWLDSPAGEGFQDQVNITLDAAMKVWLEAADPCSTECKKAHADARAAIAAMNIVGTILEGAAEATRLVEASDQQANAEIHGNG